MFPKKHRKALCLFYILVLLLWCVFPCAACASGMGEIVCDEDECYVNYKTASISPVTKHFPAEEYLAVRDFGTQETVSAARSRSIRPVPRSVRHIAIHLIPDGLRTDTQAAFRYFQGRENIPHCLCGIVITNYMHQQDGQKS